MLSRVKEWAWLVVTVLGVVFLPLAPIVVSVLFLYVTRSLQPMGVWGALGWFATAWILSIFAGVVARYIVRAVMYLRLSPAGMPHSGKMSENIITTLLAVVLYFFLFLAISPPLYAICATGIYAITAFILSNIFDD
ncbi:hypothetical protein L1O03_00160 [Corynebacterium uropygiale]|uniref:Uncharacterized protein n=1 Tax=Corynebacterium uropygiale TaxID=1775911 RepID=A0A9X1TX23_9CORY|nr:hypothetical protein [Corynebacterium uropygiale]MCF4005600.1 hypothetical protein [Corynebacterium uropygiale]